MHPIEPYLKNFLGRAYLEPLHNKIAQRYALQYLPIISKNNYYTPMLVHRFLPLINDDLFRYPPPPPPHR